MSVNGHRVLRQWMLLVACSALIAGSAAAQDQPQPNNQPQSNSQSQPNNQPQTNRGPQRGGVARRGEIQLPDVANADLPTLFLIGDSTVRTGRGNGEGGQWGWGKPIVELFDTEKINVVNRAVGGLSSRTYRTGGFWDDVLARIKPGDFVMMQFGHNDAGRLNDDSRARGTIRGVGEETEEIENILTGKREVVHSYGWYLREFINDAEAKGATCLVCSPIPRKSWREGRITRPENSYPTWARQAAEQKEVPFIDLYEIIARRYDALGEEAVDGMFADRGTHTSWEGAVLNAECVVAGLKGIDDHPLTKLLSAKGEPIEPYHE